MIVLLICSSIAKEIGGPARSIQGLAAALERAGVETHLLSLKPLDEPWVNGVNHYSTAGKFGFVGVRAEVERIIDEVHPDVIHIQSLWMLNLHMAAVAARRKHVPYMISMRGAISEWALSQSRWRKKLALVAYQGYDIRCAAALHATSEYEAGRIRTIGYGNKHIVVCPNGVNLPANLPDWNRRPNGKRKMLFLSRVHKVKGLIDLVKAWAIVDPKDWVLEIAGNDDSNYWPHVKECIESLGISDKIIRSESLLDGQKWYKYREADCFVLPSHSENFGIVVVEALYAGLPVITTQATPWKDLVDRRCGWWVEVGVEPLVKALKEMIAMDDVAREEMGLRGRLLVDEKYNWDAVIKEMITSYIHIISSRN